MSDFMLLMERGNWNYHKKSESLAFFLSVQCSPGFYFEAGVCLECPVGEYSEDFGEDHPIEDTVDRHRVWAGGTAPWLPGRWHKN